MAQKFYVVWAGRQKGVFTDWPSVQRSVDKFPGARFKSFATRAEAEEAFRDGPGIVSPPKTSSREQSGLRPGKPAAALPHQPFDVSIYCDGACDPNPGNAGSGIAVYRAGVLAELWYGLYNPKGTNNTAELNALYHALRMAEAEIEAENTVEVCSDSLYAIKCVATWAPGWEKRGWKKAGGEIRNLEIIQACYSIYRRIGRRLTLRYVAGHSGIEGNELADRMAMLAADRREKDLRRYEGPLNVPELLKLRAG
jgi:ribonuclease HI